MIPWEHLGQATLPLGGIVSLHRRGQELSIRIDGQELMNSRIHGSEEALAERGCAMLNRREGGRVLVGGLGMGFTLAAALRAMPADAEVVVAELVPAVIEWNRGIVGEVAGRPLDDPRARVDPRDVRVVIRDGAPWDAILLDVDNGPEGLTTPENDRLYSPAGLAASIAALSPGGVLGVWSSAGNPAFTKRLQRAGFAVDEVRVRARAGKKGSTHMLWMARRRA